MSHQEQHVQDPEDTDEHAPPHVLEDLESEPVQLPRKPIAVAPRRRFFSRARSRVFDDTKEIVKLIKDINGKPKEAVTAEAQSELEKTKLTIWLIKALVWFMAAVTILIVLLVIYSTTTNVDIIVPSFIGDAFGTFKEIVVTIIEEKG